MLTEYLCPMARNLRTGQTVKQQDLSGRRYRSGIQSERQEAEMAAQSLAERMTQRDGDTWQGYTTAYVINLRR